MEGGRKGGKKERNEEGQEGGGVQTANLLSVCVEVLHHRVQCSLCGVPFVNRETEA